MCLAVFSFCPQRDAALVVYETRDQSIHLPHGRPAAAGFGIDTASYACHWRDNPQLLDRVWTFRIGHDRDLLAEPIIGGLDAGGGTWMAVNQRTGVYARILIAPMASGELGESASDELRARRASLGYVTRSGLCLDAVSYPSAAAAAKGLQTDLPAALDRDRKLMLPLFLLLADASDAYVVRLHEDGRVEVTPITDCGTHVLTVRGLDTPAAALSQILLDRLAEQPRPDTDPASWDGWLSAFAIDGRISDDDYRDPSWRAHRSTALQPPYLNTLGQTRHQRAPWPSQADAGEVEWTKSTTCVVIGQDGLRTFLYEERHVTPGQPWPQTISAAAFPASSADYTLVTELAAR
ncbi:hypothetical protein Cs7R123_02330 [Catellatospora sp. TT07R-123]|uniref:hypothetical protein n=1 Tax=Catellatospora sp. TT07R-123 TaxID=2733863 RepID=UPI001B2E7025|nr:hypothetical protein [Catellatospora sp. TT07R-123]GHJ42891.1 hypothetical protein Cs7R123_02330 [Catellatospora sp. TT07R-123]